MVRVIFVLCADFKILIQNETNLNKHMPELQKTWLLQITIEGASNLITCDQRRHISFQIVIPDIRTFLMRIQGQFQNVPRCLIIVQGLGGICLR